MKTETTKLIGEVTQAQVEEWKAKYGKVYAITVDGHITYIRKIDRATTSAALSRMSFKMTKNEDTDGNDTEISLGKLFQTGEVVVNNCRIGGSEDVKNDPVLWMNTCTKAGEILEFREAELKNL